MKFILSDDGTMILQQKKSKKKSDSKVSRLFLLTSLGAISISFYILFRLIEAFLSGGSSLATLEWYEILEELNVGTYFEHPISFFEKKSL